MLLIHHGVFSKINWWHTYGSISRWPYLIPLIFMSTPNINIISTPITLEQAIRSGYSFVLKDFFSQRRVSLISIQMLEKSRQISKSLTIFRLGFNLYLDFGKSRNLRSLNLPTHKHGPHSFFSPSLVVPMKTLPFNELSIPKCFIASVLL